MNIVKELNILLEDFKFTPRKVQGREDVAKERRKAIKEKIINLFGSKEEFTKFIKQSLSALKPYMDSLEIIMHEPQNSINVEITFPTKYSFSSSNLYAILYIWCDEPLFEIETNFILQEDSYSFFDDEEFTKESFIERWNEWSKTVVNGIIHQYPI